MRHRSLTCQTRLHVKYSLAVANGSRTRSAAKSRAVGAAFFDAIAVKRESISS
jgi:hypothetical protein